MVVLCRRQLRKKVFYRLLAALACFDLIFVLSYLILHVYCQLASKPTNHVLYNVFYPILNVGFSGSIYMTTAISIERYLGVCHNV